MTDQTPEVVRTTLQAGDRKVMVEVDPWADTVEVLKKINPPRHLQPVEEPDAE